MYRSMRRAIITIDEQGRVHFPDTNANEIWMSTAELVELLGVTYPTIRAAIKAICKSGIVNEYEAERYTTLPNGNGMNIYSLQMITALIFRIDTPEAYKLREAIISRLCRRDTKVNSLMMYISPHNTQYHC